MSNILNNVATGDQPPGTLGSDETLDPVAPQEPTLTKAPLGVPTAAREPESSVGSGMGPP